MRRSIAQVLTNENGPLVGGLTRSRLLMLRSLAIGVLRLGGASANYLLQGWIARICGPHEFGVYTLSWSIVMFAAVISNVGWQLLVIQVIPEYLEKRLPALAKGFLLSAHGVLAAASVAIMVVIVLAQHFVPPFLPTNIPIPYLLAIPSLAFFSFWMQLAVPLNAAMLGYCAYNLLFTFNFAALVAGIAVLGNEADAWSIGIALNLALTGSWILLAGSLCHRPPLRDILRQRPAFAFRRWSAASPFLFAVSVLEVAQLHFHILLASIWLTPAQVGVLYAATRSASVLELLCSGYGALFMPILARHYHARDVDGVREQFKKSARGLLIVCLASVAVCIVGGRELLKLFGSEFTEGYVTLVILVAAFATRYASGPCLQLLLIASMRKTILQAPAVAFLINVAISLLLVPRYGFDVVAIGPACGMTAGTIVILVALWRRFGVFSMFGRTR